MKEEYFRELPSLKGIWYAGFSAGKKIILEKLKEKIKKENYERWNNRIR